MALKRIFFFLTIIMSVGMLTYAQTIDFDKYFHNRTMRLDYHHTGDSKTEIISPDKIYSYDSWGRNKVNLLDQFNNGRYYVKIYDTAERKLIYSKGYDSYFGEYKLSGPAAKGIIKTFHETAIFPHPKQEFRFVIERRNERKVMEEFYSTIINPDDIGIIRLKAMDCQVTIVKSHFSGNPEKRVDIAIIGDGYSKNDIKKFEKDMKKFTDFFFSQEPYKSMKNSFNIYGILKPSEESGVDEPRADIYKNTTLSSTFNSMNSERYLLTEDNKTLHDLAALVPFDAITIMVNHARYGGGGIYNFFATFTTDNQFAKYLFIHEFGHSFGGLADEYYTSSTAYNDFYPLGIEPVEPNITAMLDPENVKWKELLSDDIAVPTPWEKEDFDKSDAVWQKERAEMNNLIARLKREQAPQSEIDLAEKEYAQKDRAHSDKVDKYLQASKYWGKVGVYEGAGYASRGLYRPMLDCIMFSKGDKPFCKVCEAAVRRVIKHYTGE